MIVDTLLVAAAFVAAAGLGATARYGLATALNRDLPRGTLAANQLASFLLGLGSELINDTAAIVTLGAVGALSTWSAVANEAAIMARSGQGRLAVSYLALTVTTGVIAAWLGLQFAPAGPP